MSEKKTKDPLAPSIVENPWVRAGLVLGVIALLAVTFASLNLDPDLKSLDTSILSGSKSGNYWAVVDRMVAVAKHRRGKLNNISSRGSLDNIRRLKTASKSCDISFGLTQDGLPWGKDHGLELIARLTEPETVFLLGRKAGSIRAFADLANKRIGIGPKGSGTARLGQQIFETRGLQGLGVKMEHRSIESQLQELLENKLDLGLFVIARDADFIDEAVRVRGLEIASFVHAEALAHRLPVVRAEWLEAGHYDPVAVIPPEPRRVLVVDTLIVGNGCSSRAQTIGMLTLLADAFPELIQHNRGTPNTTGLPLNDDARSFFDNEGPELLDQYAPWLADLIPLSNLIQLAMVISILFNAMGAANRFRLWRVDAKRVNLENVLPDIFGPTVVVGEVAKLKPVAENVTDEKRQRLDALIGELEKLKGRCRKYSVSMLVPMGREMGYRYQESLIDEQLLALRTFRRRLG